MGLVWRKAARGKVSFTETVALVTDSVEPWTGSVKLKNHSFLHFKVDSVRIFTKPAPVNCDQVWVFGVAASVGRPKHSSPQPSIPAPPMESKSSTLSILPQGLLSFPKHTPPMGFFMGGLFKGHHGQIPQPPLRWLPLTRDSTFTLYLELLLSSSAFRKLNSTKD